MNRTLIWQLAWRYLRGKRTANAAPLLSRISMVAIAVSSAAMVIVFSIFNGLEGVVKDLYKGFYPDMRVTAARGKFFRLDAAKLAAVRQVPGIHLLTTVLEDNVIVSSERSGERRIATLKGIDRTYLRVNDITGSLAGEDSVSAGNPYTAIAGASMLNELGVHIDNVFGMIEVWYGNAQNTNFIADPTSAYRRLQLHPAGEFRISDEFDDRYILAPLPLVQTLFNEEGKYSSLEMKIDVDREEEVKAALQQLLGTGYKVETRYEQNKTIFTVMRSEKWAIYAILVMVLLVASFNMVGALSVLVLEKQKDIAILRAMGAEQGTIRSVFITEGILWSLAGGLAGLVLGVLLCLAQLQFGLVKVGGAFLMDAYPVEIHSLDLLLVIVTVMVVGILAAWYPAVRAVRAAAPALRSA
ncbi:FtsX-like permease family protein [Nemorincola caseinilytica]|uniref:FtsX-like permease family protein n=1 Tax=Nemorincola caseinilytica TaxID=2054315 RepID=A0ABP8NCH1_9BACT